MKVLVNYFFVQLIVSLFSNYCFSQAVLDYNNTSLNISANGKIENVLGVAAYNIPKESLTSTLFSLNYIIGAKDINDTIYVSDTYKSNSYNSIYSGPITNDYTNYEYQGRWNNKIWKLSQSEIDHFRALWMCEQGLTSSGCDTISELSPSVLNTIYTWPANGDTTRNESAQLAPFFDRNNNGVYEPNLGDYPIIKGMSAIYVIQNDDAGSYLQAIPYKRMGIEIHTMYYQFSAFNEINDATFMDVTIFNRRALDYHDFIFGINLDGDLGNYTDDYAGCDSASNLQYFYNGDNNDQSENGRNGFGLNPPAFGITALNHKMNVSTSYYSTSIYGGNDTVSIDTNVFTYKEYIWFLLNGIKSTGQPYIHPNGYETTYQFSGNPTHSNEWTEFTNNNPPGDRRAFFGTEPLNFQHGQQLNYSFAFVYERSGNNIENVSELINNVPIYNQAYESNFEDYNEPTRYNLTAEELTNFTTYPNPLSTGSTLNFPNPTNENLTISIVDISGNIIQTINNITSQSVELNRSNLKNGIYFIELRNQQVLIAKGKVIVD